jgi:hypothetical protein
MLFARVMQSIIIKTAFAHCHKLVLDSNRLLFHKLKILFDRCMLFLVKWF